MNDNELEDSKAIKVKESKKFQIISKPLLYLESIKEFDGLIKENHNKMIIVNFWANWCGPCKEFAPFLEKIRQDYDNHQNVIFAKVDIGKEKMIPHRCKISSIPTLIIIKNGKYVFKNVGPMNYNRLKDVMERYINFEIKVS